MPRPVEFLHDELRRRRISRTRGRDEVYRGLARLGPCSLQGLTVALSGQVSYVTVYRAVELFREIGVVRLLNNDLIELQEPFGIHRHSFVCRVCERRVDFCDDKVEMSLERAMTGRNLVPEGHTIEVRGLCSLCLG